MNKSAASANIAQRLAYLVMICLFVTTNSWATNSELTTIRLQHQDAEEIIKAIQPLLSTQDAISSKDQQLIIRAAPELLTQIRQLITELDHPPALLLIELQQPIIGSRQYHQLNQADDNQGQDQRQPKHYRTDDRDTAINSQQLQLLDGHSAAISAGRLVPMASIQRDQNGQARPVIEHKAITSGFQITPHLIEEEVRIEVAPFASTLSSKGGIIEQQGLYTTVRAPLNRWVEIGGHSGSAGNSQAIHYATQDRRTAERSIFIRIKRVSE